MDDLGRRKMKKMKLMNHFKEMCTFKPWQSGSKHLVSRINKEIKKEQMDEEMKRGMLQEYCRRFLFYVAGSSS